MLINKDRITIFFLSFLWSQPLYKKDRHLSYINLWSNDALAKGSLFQQSLPFMFLSSLARFWRTRERVCFNLYWSCVACCWDTVSNPGRKAVRLIQWAQLKQSILFLNECSHPKTGLTRENQDWVAKKLRLRLLPLKASRDSGRASFSPPPSRRQKEALLAGCSQIKEAIRHKGNNDSNSLFTSYITVL